MTRIGNMNLFVRPNCHELQLKNRNSSDTPSFLGKIGGDANELIDDFRSSFNSTPVDSYAQEGSDTATYFMLLSGEIRLREELKHRKHVEPSTPDLAKNYLSETQQSPDNILNKHVEIGIDVLRHRPSVTEQDIISAIEADIINTLSKEANFHIQAATSSSGPQAHTPHEHQANKRSPIAEIQDKASNFLTYSKGKSEDTLSNPNVHLRIGNPEIDFTERHSFQFLQGNEVFESPVLMEHLGYSNVDVRAHHTLNKTAPEVNLDVEITPGEYWPGEKIIYNPLAKGDSIIGEVDSYDSPSIDESKLEVQVQFNAVLSTYASEKSPNIVKTTFGQLGEQVFVELQWRATGHLSVVSNDFVHVEDYGLSLFGNLSPSSSNQAFNGNSGLASSVARASSPSSVPTYVPTNINAQQSTRINAQTEPLTNRSSLSNLMAFSYSEIPKRKITITKNNDGIEVLVRDYHITTDQLKIIASNIYELEKKFGERFQSLTVNGSKYEKRGI